jgi:hypothetical protein
MSGASTPWNFPAGFVTSDDFDKAHPELKGYSGFSLPYQPTLFA